MLFRTAIAVRWVSADRSEVMNATAAYRKDAPLQRGISSPCQLQVRASRSSIVLVEKSRWIEIGGFIGALERGAENKNASVTANN